MTDNKIPRSAALPRFLLVSAALVVGSLAWHSVTAQGEEAQYTREGAEDCLSCHGPGDEHPAHEILRTPHALKADDRTPFGEERHQCETCHGPSQSHLSRRADGSRPPVDFSFEGDRAAEEMNTVCLDCHQGGARVHWPATIHNQEGLACVDCHTLHAERDPVLVMETQPQVCFGCHKTQRAEFHRPSTHPVEAGMLSCSDCHAPHGGAGPSHLVKSTVNETCYDCHAEKRGPFLWEHAPVREDCTNCHTPHGSIHDDLLIAKSPWLCQRCHQAQFHPSTAYSGTGVPPQGAAQQLLLKGCQNCHSQVHGSNHPSGVRKTR